MKTASSVLLTVRGAGYLRASRCPFIAETMGGGPKDANKTQFVQFQYDIRRTADKDLGVRARSRKLLSDVLFRDEANSTFPVSRSVVQDVIDLETIREHGNEVVEFSPEQNVLLVNVRVDEGEFGGVTRVEKGVTDNLKHGGDTSSTSDETELGSKIRGVFKLALGPFDTDCVTDFDKRKITRDIALLICLKRTVQNGCSELDGSSLVHAYLHDKVEMSKVIIAGSGSVTTHNVLAINLGSHGDVLSSGKPEIVLWIRETKTIEGGIGRNFNLLDKREVPPGIRTEDWFTT